MVEVGFVPCWHPHDQTPSLRPCGYPLDLDFYPQLKKLIMISKTIPVSTATVERSFSAMNRTFSWARSSLDSLEQVI